MSQFLICRVQFIFRKNNGINQKMFTFWWYFNQMYYMVWLLVVLIFIVSYKKSAVIIFSIPVSYFSLADFKVFSLWISAVGLQVCSFYYLSCLGFSKLGSLWLDFPDLWKIIRRPIWTNQLLDQPIIHSFIQLILSIRTTGRWKKKTPSPALKRVTTLIPASHMLWSCNFKFVGLFLIYLCTPQNSIPQLRHTATWGEK